MIDKYTAADKRAQIEAEHCNLLNQLATKKEPLHADLVGHICSCTGMGDMVHHPLVVVPIFQPERFAYVYHLYTKKKKVAEKLRQKGDWSSYMLVHEKPYLLDVFAAIEKQLSDEEYWIILGEVYTRSENAWQHWRKLKRLLTADRKQRELLMNGKDRNYLAKLPSTLTIHRGIQHGNAAGWSWTLDPKKARWFARRFGDGKPTVATGTVKKRDVIAYFSFLREREIVVDPAVVNVLERIRL